MLLRLLCSYHTLLFKQKIPFQLTVLCNISPTLTQTSYTLLFYFEKELLMSESNSTTSALVVIQLQTYLNCIEVSAGSWTRLEGSKCTSDLYWNSNVSCSFVTGKYWELPLCKEWGLTTIYLFYMMVCKY